MTYLLSEKFIVRALGAVSLVSYGYVGMNLLSFGAVPSGAAPAAYTQTSIKDKLNVATFRTQVEQGSRDDVLVVVLHRNNCAVCPDVMYGLDQARERLIKKTGRGFSVLALNAEQNPDIARVLRQREPDAPVRLHGFYKGEKIYESLGVTDQPRELTEILEMVQALALGQVSAYDKYQPARVFEAPLP